MKPKKKALGLIVVFAVVTVFDLFFTWKATPDLLMEANILVKYLDMGWPALLISNLLVFFVYGVLVWYSFVSYKAPTFPATGFIDYINRLDEYKTHSPFLAALGFAMGYSMIIGRLMPVIEWGVYLAGYIMVWYDKLKMKVPMGRPDLCMIFILAIVFVIYWYYREYKENGKRSHRASAPEHSGREAL